MAESPFILVVVGGLRDEQREFFERHRARIFDVDAFDSRHGPSNKLRFFEIEELDAYEHIVLLDCDTIVVQDPSEWVLAGSGFAAKPADFPTVKVDALSAFLRSRDLPVPRELDYRHDVADAPGLPYFNSGVIVLTASWRTRLIEAWERFDRELIECAEEFDIPAFHVDQASLTAALLAEDVPIRALPSAMNYPVHLDVSLYSPDLYGVDPIVIHYHWLADENGYIEPLPFPRAGLRIRMFNARLRAERFGRATPNGHSRDLGYRVLKSIGSRITEGNRDGLRDKPKVVVGSGWWSSDAASEWAIGAPETRSTWFFDIWYRQVMSSIGPNRIVVTDSHSPIKPDWSTYPGVHWIELDENYGHPNDLRTGRIKTKFSGYTRSVINGAMHAYCCDADYYVYVEQDCLIRGAGFLEKATGDSAADILLGARTQGGVGIEGKPAAPMFQNSLIIVRKEGLERFIAGIVGAPWGDGEISIEIIMERRCGPFDVIAVPYGRSRPIDFDCEHFYAQHMTESELRRFLEVEDIPLSVAVAGSVFDV